MEKIKVGVVGATGYAGAEICRLIAGHPAAELAAISSVSFEGEGASARLGVTTSGSGGAGWDASFAAASLAAANRFEVAIRWLLSF